MLIGNVGKEPEIRYVGQDLAVATLGLATTNRAYVTKDGTNVPETTDWHTVILWRALAKTVEQYVHKGDKIYVEGELHYKTYTDRNGISYNRAEIWANKLELFKLRSAGNTSVSNTNFPQQNT